MTVRGGGSLVYFPPSADSFIDAVSELNDKPKNKEVFFFLSRYLSARSGLSLSLFVSLCVPQTSIAEVVYLVCAVTWEIPPRNV